MAKVPVVNDFSTTYNPTPTPYNSIHTDASMFNPNLGAEHITEGVGNLANASVKIYKQRAAEQAKIREEQTDILAMEKGTEFNKMALESLYDTHSGLFVKTGKAYLNSMTPVLEDLNNKKDMLLEGLDSDQYAKVYKVLNNTYENYYTKVTQNALKEQDEYRKNTLDNLIETQTQMAIVNRNDAQSVIVNLGNINASIAATYGDSIDDEQLQAIQKAKTSEVLVSVLSARIADKNPNSKAFFDMFKSQIDSKKHSQLMEEISRMNIDMQSRDFAANSYNSGVDETTAFNKAMELDKKYGTDSFTTKITSLYGKQRTIQHQEYEDKKDKFWESFAQNPDPETIPSWLKGSDRVTAQNYCKQGGGKANPDTYIKLYEMSATNAEEFAKINLNDYRDKLSPSEYKHFAERQQKIKMHDYSNLNGNDSRCVEVANALGLRIQGEGRKTAIATYAQGLINAEEKRLGRKLNEAEQNKFFEYLGYKGGQEKTFDTIEKYGGRATFYKEVANDLTYFQKVHGRMPDSKEFNDIVYRRGANALVKQNSQTYQAVLKDVRAKQNETKSLTYFADTVAPQIGRKLGTKLTVTSRYRDPSAQGYKSHHSEGRALDISMSEHSIQTRKRIVAEILQNPMVEKIGTSDTAILGLYKNNSKIVDERSFDKQNGTNHINHVHITLKNDGSRNNTNTTIVKIRTPDGRIVNVPQNMVQQAIKLGGVRVNG